MKLKVNTNNLQHPVEIETAQGLKLTGVRGIRYEAAAGSIPTLDVDLYAMTDQEFEVANCQCKIEVRAHVLADYPIQMLKMEMERRGYEVR